MELSLPQILILLPAIGVIAFLYSSVGHGGATGYLAIMTLAGISPILSRPGALWLNCIVAGIACWRFMRAGFFDRSVFFKLAVASVPMAWLGSRLHLQQGISAMVLGITLAAAGWFLGWGRKHEDETVGRASVFWPFIVVAGALLGFVSGLTGIGGGVFLTPLLILLRWVPSKTAGGISAAFILVNSVAGLAGLGSQALSWGVLPMFGPVVAALGALGGTYCGVHLWKTTAFRRALAVVLWVAAAKLLLTMKG